MNDDKPRTLSQLIGERVRKAREAAGRRQQDIARAANILGFDWTRSSVASLEAGTRKLSPEELARLPIVLLGASIPPTDLVLEDDEIALPVGTIRGQAILHPPLRADPALLADFEELRSAITESRRDTPITQLRYRLESRLWLINRRGEASRGEDDRAILAEIVAQAAPLIVASVAWDDRIDQSKVGRVLATTRTELERKSATRLGTRPEIVACMAQVRWSRSIDQERDQRAKDEAPEASGRALQSLKGHITRTLIAELGEEWAARGGQVEELFARLRSHGDDVEAQARDLLTLFGRVPLPDLDRPVFAPEIDAEIEAEVDGHG